MKPRPLEASFTYANGNSSRRSARHHPGSPNGGRRPTSGQESGVRLHLDLGERVEEDHDPRPGDDRQDGEPDLHGDDVPLAPASTPTRRRHSGQAGGEVCSVEHQQDDERLEGDAQGGVQSPAHDRGRLDAGYEREVSPREPRTQGPSPEPRRAKGTLRGLRLKDSNRSEERQLVGDPLRRGLEEERSRWSRP